MKYALIAVLLCCSGLSAQNYDPSINNPDPLPDAEVGQFYAGTWDISDAWRTFVTMGYVTPPPAIGIGWGVGPTAAFGGTPSVGSEGTYVIEVFLTHTTLPNLQGTQINHTEYRTLTVTPSSGGGSPLPSSGGGGDDSGCVSLSKGYVFIPVIFLLGAIIMFLVIERGLRRYENDDSLWKPAAGSTEGRMDERPQSSDREGP